MTGQINKLISVEQALAADHATYMAWYQRHVNEVLARTTRLAGLNRRFVRAQGTRLWDQDGAEYLDFFNIFGCVGLGHHHPRVVAALQAGLSARVPLMQKLSPSCLEAALAHNLAVLLPEPLSVSYFASSGAEAVEAAIKLARGYSKRSALLATHGCYHGLTMGALALTGMPAYRRDFEPTMPGVDHVPFDDLDRLAEALKTRQYAALFLEPILGQGGIVIPRSGYLKEAGALCRKYGTLLVLDEIQTGLGRTGKWFAFEHEDVVPDVLLLSKALGGGAMAISACITSPEIWRRVYGSIKRFLMNSNTFGSNGLACLAALATLETIATENLPENAASRGEDLRARLGRLQSEYPVIEAVRGRGLMVGLIFDLASWNPVDRLSRQLIDMISGKIVTSFIASRLLNDQRIVVAPSMTSEYLIRVFPPLNVQTGDIDRFMDGLRQVCASLSSYSGVFLNTVKSFVKERLA